MIDLFFAQKKLNSCREMLVKKLNSHIFTNTDIEERINRNKKTEEVIVGDAPDFI